jgi:hypothetical protein
MTASHQRVVMEEAASGSFSGGGFCRNDGARE